MGNCLKTNYEMTPSTSVHNAEEALKNPNRGKIEEIETSYQVGKKVGDGRSATVYEGWQKSNPDRRLAIKSLSKKLKPKGSAKKSYFHEIDILCQLHHRNISFLVDNMQGSKNYYVVTRMLDGGELFDRIVDRKYDITEKIASGLVKQMLTALRVCHGRNIVHRDLKPENFVFESMDEDSALVMIDFGASMVVEDDKSYRDFICTPTYASPEIAAHAMGRSLLLSGAKMKASDMWSVGVITYVMLTGREPFGGDTNQEIFTNVLNQSLKFPGPNDKYPCILSKECRDFMSRTLCKDFSKRMTLEEALRHPWVSGNIAEDIELNKDVIQLLRQYKFQTKFKQVITEQLMIKSEEKMKKGLMGVDAMHELRLDAAKRRQSEELKEAESTASLASIASIGSSAGGGASASNIGSSMGSNMGSNVANFSTKHRRQGTETLPTTTATDVEERKYLTSMEAIQDVPGSNGSESDFKGQESPTVSAGLEMDENGNNNDVNDVNENQTVCDMDPEQEARCRGMHAEFLSTVTTHFGRLDRSETGHIGAEELGQLLAETGFEENEIKAEVDKIMKQVDTDGNGSIELREYKKMFLRKQLVKKKELIKIVFESLDTNNDGEIDGTDLEMFFGETFGVDFHEMIKEVDKRGTSTINFSEFSKIMREKVKPNEIQSQA